MIKTLLSFFIRIACILWMVNLPASVSAQEHIIGLSELTLATKQLDFQIDSFIDVRDHKEMIGLIQKGLTNSIQQAKFEHSTVKQFKDIYDRSVQTSGTTNRLIVRINELVISELNTQMQQISKAKLNLSFLKKTGGNYHELFRASASIKAEGFDATKHHELNIVKAIDDCLKQFNDKKFSESETGTLVGNLYENPLHTNKFEVVKSDNYPKGVFKTFLDFRSNKVDTAAVFNIEYKNADSEPNRKASVNWATTDKTAKEVWGVSDGKDIYINIKNQYYRLIKQKDKFSFYDYPVIPGSGAAYAAMSGGIVGTIIGNSVDALSAKKIPYKLNFSTGSFIPLYEDNEQKTEGSIIFYLSKFVSADKQVDLYANGIKLGTLSPNSYFEFVSKIEQGEVVFTLQNGELKSTISLRPKLFVNDFYLIRFKKDQPVIDHPGSSISADILKNIKSGEILKAGE